MLVSWRQCTLRHTLRTLVDLFLGSSHGDALLRQSHFAGKRGLRPPGCALASGRLLEHPVDLFQAQTLHLRHQEVGESHGDAAERAPEEEDFRAKVGVSRTGSYEVGSDGCDDLYIIIS